MKVTTAVALAALAIPVVTPPCRAAVQAAVPDSAGLAPGAYASRQIVTSRTQPGPRSRPIAVRTIGLLLHHVRREGDRTLVHSRYCALRQDPIGNVRTVIGPGFLRSLPAWDAPAEVSDPEDGHSPDVGALHVVVVPHAEVVGARLGDPARDPLPQQPDDPRVTDPDEDGHPGVTVRVEGFVKGEVYMVQRLVRGLDGTLRPDGRMSGHVLGDNEERTLGASNLLLKVFTPSFRPDPDPERNTFTWVPVPEGTDCAALEAGEEALFGPLD
jgi:hypothetical protein